MIVLTSNINRTVATATDIYTDAGTHTAQLDLELSLAIETFCTLLFGNLIVGLFAETFTKRHHFLARPFPTKAFSYQNIFLQRKGKSYSIVCTVLYYIGIIILSILFIYYQY